MSQPDAPLTVAVPSKGRLQEQANSFFARAGLDVVQARGSRDYRGALAQMPGVEIAFLSAADIVAQLAEGRAHLGVTGEDLVRESLPNADAQLELLSPLGFGHASVVVAVPQAWIDVRTMADLEDVAGAFRHKRGERMRVATKYVNLTRRAFAAHGIGDYRVVESLGATEGAPAAGQAELIVDITTTGATLRANGLKVLEDGVLLRSQANLVASCAAQWGPAARESARAILARIAAEENARMTREVRAYGLPPRAEIMVGAGEGFGAYLRGRADAEPLVLSIARERAADLADWLVREGAGEVTVATPDSVFGASNALFDRLAQRIG